MITLPEQLELEYMLVQRRLSRGDGKLDKLRLRARLHQIAQGVARQKVKEVSALFGKKVQPPSQETINRWVDAEMESTLEYFESLPKDDGRQDAEGDLMEIIRKSLRGQREARASSALLSLNTELIEEVSRGSGSSHYRWETMKDNHVRDWHKLLQGKTIAWDEPPMGGGTRKGDEGHPGSGYGCRCWPVPIAGATPSRRPKKPPAKKRTVAGHATQGPAITKKKIKGNLEMDTRYRGRLKSDMTLSEAEKTIGSYKGEHAMAWTRNGEPLIRKTSRSNNHVSFNAYEIDHLQKNPGAIFTHNHPGTHAPALSGGDIKMALLADLSEVRAVTAKGTGTFLRVVDKQKWAAARASTELRAEISTISKRVVKEAGKTAVRRATNAVGGRVTSEVYDKAFKIQQEVFAAESVRLAKELYNRLGEKYGFIFDSFGP
jgi:hypothetical protein